MPALHPGLEIGTRQAPMACRLLGWRLNCVRCSATWRVKLRSTTTTAPVMVKNILQRQHERWERGKGYITFFEFLYNYNNLRANTMFYYFASEYKVLIFCPRIQ